MKRIVSISNEDGPPATAGRLRKEGEAYGLLCKRIQGKVTVRFP